MLMYCSPPPGNINILTALRDHVHQCAPLVLVAIPLFDSAWQATFGDMKSLYASFSQYFEMLPSQLAEHSFLDMDVQAPPLWLYSFIYAIGIVIFIVFYLIAEALRTLCIGVLYIPYSFYPRIVQRLRRTPSRPTEEESKNLTKPDNNSEQTLEKKHSNANTNTDKHFIIQISFLLFSISVTLASHSFLGLLCGYIFLLINSSLKAISSYKVHMSPRL